MLSPNDNEIKSDIRKSLESIQSLLSQNQRSPMTTTASSFASRLHRASLEGGASYPGLSPSAPASQRSSQHQQWQSLPDSGATSTMGIGKARSTSSVSFHPQSDSGDDDGVNDHRSSMRYDGSFQGKDSGDSIAILSQHQQGGIASKSSVVRRSPSSAFSTVNKLPFVRSPPLNTDYEAPGGGITHLGAIGVMDGGLGSVSSETRANIHVGTDKESQNSIGSQHNHRGYYMQSKGRRETSLLVSPIAQLEDVNVAGVHGQHGLHPHQSSSNAPPPVMREREVAASTSNNDRSSALSIATGALTSHHVPSQNNGRDPTPYHYRSYPSASPNHHQHRSNEDTNKLSDASSRSGRDPPANSGGKNLTIISTNCGQSHYQAHPTSSSMPTTGFATSKSTPNVHSYHYQNDGPNELSMIEEDASLMSNVTGSTFVRTPIVRKTTTTMTTVAATANHHTPKNNTVGGATTSSNINNNNNNTSISIHATPSASQLLHRPSLAMRESLSHIASMTSRALEEIWNCVGVAPDERASQLVDLVERIGQLCEIKVQEEEALRDQFRKEIGEARKEWEDICAALRLKDEEDPVAKLKRDPSTRELENGSGVTLQWEYEAMMGRLETLRSVKQSAMSDMQTSQSVIFNAFAALNGISVEDASRSTEMQTYLDIETNLTHERRDEFRTKAKEYEENVWTRTRAVVSLVWDCQSIIRELEIVPPTDEGCGRDEDDFKIMNSLMPIEENQIVDDDSQEQRHRPRGGDRGSSNKYDIVDVFESSTCIGIGNSALDRLTSRIAELNGEKRRRRAKLGEMGSIISTLWTMLRISSDEQKAFTMSIRGLGLDTIRKGEAEIERLEEIKGVMIGKLVREQRSIIEDLWEKTNSSDNERASFSAYYQIQDDEQLTSDILVKHEDYAASLKTKLLKMQPILNLIAKREAILEERNELELLQKDPDRLKGRGATKQLMKEEKMSRRVSKELPKITSILEESLRRWYSENKPDDGHSDHDMGHFMWNGSPYLRTMHMQEEEWRSRKERNDEERHRKRQEERDASSSTNTAFGTSYMKLPGKKWSPLVETQNSAVGSTVAGNSRPRSASTARSGSSIPTNKNEFRNVKPSSSNMRTGDIRGPLGEVSCSRQNTTSSRPPSRPRGKGEGGPAQVKKMEMNQGFRPSSAPRMRL